MASVRLSRRRGESVDPRSSIIVDHGTTFNQFEYVVPIHEKDRPTQNKAQRHLLSKSAKTKTYSSESSERFTSKSLLTLGQKRSHSSGTFLSISQVYPSRQNSKETLNLYNNQVSHVIPSLSYHNQQKIESTYPQSILIGPRILDNLCSCRITISYRSDPTLPSMSQKNSRRDEVTIFQVANDGSSWIVFKGFVKMDDSFTFKSQRSVDDRFHLKLQINGYLDTTISACCEHLYRHGGRIDDGDSSFWIETVEQYTSCTKCHESIDLSQSTDDENMVLPSNATSEESEAEEDQSVASKKSTKKVDPFEVKHGSPIKPSTDPSSSSSAVPEKPPSTPHVQSFPSSQPVTHQSQPAPVLPSSSLPPSIVYKTTTQKGPSVSVSTAEATTPDNESILCKYVNDIMQQALSKPKSSQTIPFRHIGNVENFTILYIDQDEEKDLSLLRPTVNFLRTLNDPNRLGTLLSTCTDEKVIVVISLNQAEAILPELEQHKCIDSVYVLSKETHSPEWISHDDKVIGIYPKIESIRDHLIKRLSHELFRMVSMEITPKDSTSDLPFTYCQLLKETILCQDEESNLRKDMIAFCRIHYGDNQEEVHQIDEFEKCFIDTQSIQWYTRSCFLSKVLSRAFRTQNIDLLFKMRYFIQCLHKQIQSIPLKGSITVYTILDVEQENIRKFKENINGLVLFRSFLPARFERPTSMDYQNKDTQRYLVFSILLRPNCAADIKQLRSSDCKIDVLINLDTIFRIVSIDEDENGIDIVNLESVPPDDSHFEELTESLRKEMRAPVVITQLTKLLLKTNHYWECDYLTELIYQDKSFEDDRTLLASLAAVHHLLGNVHVATKNFEAASYQFFKSLRAFQLFLPYNHSMLSSTYNNIGSMFYQDDHHKHAIKFHQMALQCQFKASSPDTDAIATYSANIGAVYMDQKNYTEALKHLKRTEIFMEKMSKKDNPKSFISIFQKISSCFWHLQKYKEALEYYKRTLDLQLKLPDPLPYPLSVTYYNLSTAYGKIDDYDKAVTCAEESIKYLIEISKDHPELKDNQAQLEIVRQKLWLKQVLSV